jgi:hypothetical protein
MLLQVLGRQHQFITQRFNDEIGRIPARRHAFHVPENDVSQFFLGSLRPINAWLSHQQGAKALSIAIRQSRND